MWHGVTEYEAYFTHIYRDAAGKARSLTDGPHGWLGWLRRSFQPAFCGLYITRALRNLLSALSFLLLYIYTWSIFSPFSNICFRLSSVNKESSGIFLEQLPGD